MARTRITSSTIAKWEEHLGKEVAGRLEAIRENDRGQLIDIRTDRGLITFGMKSKLQRLLEGVKPGAYVWITHTGRGRTKAGNEFLDFTVDVDVEPQTASADSDIPF